jgi:hypothetical protein
LVLAALNAAMVAIAKREGGATTGLALQRFDLIAAGFV